MRSGNARPPRSRGPVPRLGEFPQQLTSQAHHLTSQQPSLGLPPSAKVDECLTRVRRGGGQAWTPREVEKLATLVSANCDARGRKQWVNIASAWELTRSDQESVRTIPSLTTAYYKFVRPTENAARPVLQGMAADPSSVEVVVEDPPEPAPQVLPREHSPGPPEDVSPSMPPVDVVELKAAMVAEFRLYYRKALLSLDRQSLRRPEGEIPEKTLILGNEILKEELLRSNSRSLTSLNASVYAIAKVIVTRVIQDYSDRLKPEKERLVEAAQQRSTLISLISILAAELRRRHAVNSGMHARARPTSSFRTLARVHAISRSRDILRLMTRLIGELNIVTLEVNKLEAAKQRFLQRKRGAPPVAREPRGALVCVPVDEVREHWKPIVGFKQPFTTTVELTAWAENHKRDAPRRPACSSAPSLSEADWKTLFSKVKPWKATGPDGIQGFWWKHLPEARDRLTKWCLRVLQKPKELPRWLCRGRVVLIPKGSSEAPGPGDFRPIACLNTCYKCRSLKNCHAGSAAVGSF
ncbi:unnamed protein product [Heligmosomoides polygyrus]|uniref:Myb-like domain-containing protein n=1 Tax=Heligmosomoides polygyrus TaxID=6339 RepID=A0A183GVU4_HELPZ|nr:unnamed protein product [Heligmosomoides polygyrus]